MQNEYLFDTNIISKTNEILNEFFKNNSNEIKLDEEFDIYSLAKILKIEVKQTNQINNIGENIGLLYVKPEEEKIKNCNSNKVIISINPSSQKMENFIVAYELSYYIYMMIKNKSNLIIKSINNFDYLHFLKKKNELINCMTLTLLKYCHNLEKEVSKKRILEP